MTIYKLKDGYQKGLYVYTVVPCEPGHKTPSGWVTDNLPAPLVTPADRLELVHRYVSADGKEGGIFKFGDVHVSMSMRTVTEVDRQSDA